MFFERQLMRKRQIPQAAFWKITRITDFPGSRTSPYATLNALRRLPNLLACLRKKGVANQRPTKKAKNKIGKKRSYPPKVTPNQTTS